MVCCLLGGTCTKGSDHMERRSPWNETFETDVKIVIYDYDLVSLTTYDYGTLQYMNIRLNG